MGEDRFSGGDYLKLFNDCWLHFSAAAESAVS
jgi:hypothetical protein